VSTRRNPELKVLSKRNKVAGLLPLHPVLTFFGRAKKVNKETRHPRAIRKSILGSLANSLPCRQVKQARLKASKNTFAHNRLRRGYKNKKLLKNLKSQKPSFQSGSAWNP